MDRETMRDWLCKVEGFNDFEAAVGDHGELASLLGAAVPLDELLLPLGFHGSGSWIALWRRDVATPWDRAAMVWLDSEGEPWEPFAATPIEGLAMLALDTGAVYDALSRACSVFESADADDESERLATWNDRTQRELDKAASRWPAQSIHRARLASVGAPLPANAFAYALAALRAHGSFARWLATLTPAAQ